jgi:competence protein ComEC
MGLALGAARGGVQHVAALRDALLDAEYGRFALWLPVLLGAGDALYFAARVEPPAWAGMAVLLPAALGFVLARRLMLLRGLFAGLAALALGFVLAQAAAARAPALLELPRHAVQVSGVVGAVEPLVQGGRVLLTAVQLDGAPVLARAVRIRLRGDDAAGLAAGDRIALRAMLRIPPPPAYPGAWDLQRDAYFAGLGGYGYALGAVRLIGRAPRTGFGTRVQGLREAIARRVAGVLPGAEGAISSTLLTGINSSIPEADRAAFRDSGLAHLLAIAGLHIGIVMGLLMALARLALAAWPWAALRLPVKQIAGLIALAGGGGYMLLTGMHVPIMRSFAMACLVTLGLLAGRRALSLRGLALAAATLIAIAPAQITGVSFQMSFSAVLALIVGYDLLRPWLRRLHGEGGAGRRILSHVVALGLTSLLAGTASAPFAAYHFGHVQIYFIVANMLAVPLVAFWVMPAGMLALALMPLGLAWLALWPMGWGIAVVLWVARGVSSWPAATLPVAHLPLWGLLLVTVGMAWAGLWRSRLRLVGLPVLVLGLLSPLAARPPDVLVSADARLIALRTPEAMWVSSRGPPSGFTLDAWERYWDRLPVGTAAVVGCKAGACVLRPRVDAVAALLLTDGGASCAGGAVILAAEPLHGRCDGAGVPVIDRFSVWRNGAYAVWLGTAGAQIRSDREERGVRPWVPTLPGRQRAAAGLPMAQSETPP